MIVYDNNKLSELSSDIKRNTIIAVFSVVAAIMICIVLCFFAMYETGGLFIAINSVLTIIGGVISINVLFGKILPLISRKKHIEKLQTGVIRGVEGYISDFEKTMTVSSALKVVLLEIVYNNEKRVYYLDTEYSLPQIKVNDFVKLKVVDNYIVEYEVLDRE